jgi:hypothetical protein
MNFSVFLDWTKYLKLLQEKHVKTNGFIRGELEDIFTSLRNDAEFPLVFCEGFRVDFLDNFRNKNRETSFSILLDYQEKGDRVAIDNCISKAESIGDEFIRKIKEDVTLSNCQSRIIEVSSQPIENPANKIAGVRYTLKIIGMFKNAINVEEWE